MMRPFVKYPVNHHLAQILERYVVIAAVRAGPALLEASTFNGDEPTGPYGWPSARRFGDSWSVRGTLAPLATRAPAPAGLELSASVARVPSPENVDGSGLDQGKSSLALRFGRGGAIGAAGMDDPRAGEYALVEWARTDEYSSGRRSFTFTSALAEGALAWRGVALSGRLERSERPEEERLVDLFRSARPHTDASILGTTRWTIGTVHLSRPIAPPGWPVRLAPFVEVSRLHAAEVSRPSAFVPAAFYGRDRVWNTSAGVLLSVGMPRAEHRMGRYGLARAAHDDPDLRRREAGRAAPTPEPHHGRGH
jgi:hypothetical protein